MKTQHTKGKWENSITGIKSDKGLLIAQCWYGNNSNAEGNLNAVPSFEEYHSNAKLIAAAPELLDVLIKLSSHLNLTSNQYGMLEKAIKKATE